MTHIDLLRWAGLFTYVCVGLPLLMETLSPPRGIDAAQHAGWIVSYAAFGVSYWFLTHSLNRRRRTWASWLLLLTMNVSAIAISAFSDSGLVGILVLLIAGVLPWMLPVGWAVVWLVAQTLAMIPTFALAVDGYNWLLAALQTGLYLGFVSFTFVTSLVAKEQTEAREEQRRLNAELRATRVLLAESTRMNERVRISRELHDLLGHHLTALSLNLEVASHLAQGPARERVQQSQSLARLLLSDVREAVSQLRADDAVDLKRALAALVEGLPQPAVHVDVADDFRVDDPRHAQVLLRCAQEVVTNTVRHARAENLWLELRRGDDGELVLSARDDGQGSAALAPGNGLAGMRERLQQVGGTLKMETGAGRGFALEARIPQEMTA
jgi:signal transduction histidine kinase